MRRIPRWARRSAQVLGLAGVLVFAWPSASQAGSGQTVHEVECYEDPGLAEDIKDVFSAVTEWFDDQTGETPVQPGDPPFEHRETAPFVRVDQPDAPGHTPAWQVTEVLEHGECYLANRIVNPPCPEDNSTYQSPSLPPEKCWGRYPTWAYALTHHGPDDLFDFEGHFRQLSGTLTGLLFNIASALVSGGLWIITWAFEFKISDISDLATDVGGRYQTRLVDPSGLQYAAWFVLWAWVGFTALRGRLSVAGGELLLSIVMASLAAVLVTDVTDDGGYLEDLSARIEEASGAVLMAGAAEEPADVEAMDVTGALRPFQRKVHEVFVEQPYDYLNWGKPLEGTCAAARDNILSVATAFDGFDISWARRYMVRQGCAAEAAFNSNPSGSRWVGAMLNMLVALILLGVLGLTALGVVGAKFSLAVLFALAPIFAVAAVLPGRGRRIAWSWLGMVTQVALIVIALSTLLGVLVVAADTVMDATDGRDLFERWLLQVVVLGAAFLGRRRLLHSLNAFAQWFPDTLSRTSPTFAGQPVAPPARAGLDVTRGDLAAQYAVGAVGLVGGRTLVLRARERRVAARANYHAKQRQAYEEVRGSLRPGGGRRMANMWWGTKRQTPRVSRWRR